jgi:hypothetical protein
MFRQVEPLPTSQIGRPRTESCSTYTTTCVVPAAAIFALYAGYWGGGIHAG